MTTETRLTDEQIEKLNWLVSHHGPDELMTLPAREVASLLSEVRASRAAATDRAATALDYCRLQRPLWLADAGPNGRTYAHGWADALLAVETLLAGSAAREDGAPPSTSEPLTPLEEIAASLHAGTCPHNPQEETQPIDCFECLMAALDRAQKTPAPAPGAAPATLDVRACADGIAYPGIEGAMPTAAEDEEIDKAMRAASPPSSVPAPEPATNSSNEEE